MKIEEAKRLISEARGILRGVAAMIDEGYEDVLREAIEELNCAILALESEGGRRDG